MSAGRLFAELRHALEATGIPYMVTGSFAAAVHGIPRATQDIDVVIAPTMQQLRALLGHFPATEYCAEIEDALQALQHRTQFNVIDHNSIWKVDFILQKERPFSSAEFDRRQRAEILGVPVYVASPEDLLIAKLEWAKAGQSDEQIRDAAGIISVQGSTLDLPYLETWIDSLSLHAQWAAAQRLIR